MHSPHRHIGTHIDFDTHLTSNVTPMFPMCLCGEKFSLNNAATIVKLWKIRKYSPLISMKR